MSQGERRLAAIMFTDMVGYTALGQRNESLSLALVDEQRKLVRAVLGRHNGKEVKTIGDAFLVVFPNALDAVNCAYDIQRATREFNFTIPEDRKIHLRIGVHLGDVVESEGDISGDAVNIASRIEALAEDGGVCITRPVYESTHNKFELPLISLGYKSLKNVSEPVEVYKMDMPWHRANPPLGTQPMTRIAVLPFRNMSSDPNDEYFAEGMTEEIISTVSGISGLEVISRTSVTGYKGTTKRVNEIGKELNVGSILEGSFRKVGNRIRVTTQLIEVAGDKHLWAQNYDRNLDDIFAVQTDVAKQVAESLKVRLLEKEIERIEKKPTESTTAYSLYLKGRQHWNKRGPEDLGQALACFEEAVKEDPNFALGYVGMADCLLVLASNWGVDPSGNNEKARRLVAKALELDPQLAEAHTTLATSLDRNFLFDEAEVEYKRAILLKPSYPTAHQWFSILLTVFQRWDEAIEQIEKALELDPLSAQLIYNHASIFWGMRDYERMVLLLERAVSLAPNLSYAHGTLAYAYAKTKRFDDMKREFSIASELEREIYPKTEISTECIIAQLTGDKQVVGRLLPEIESHMAETGSSAMDIARYHFFLGDKGKGFEWLERAYATKDFFLRYLKSDESLDSVRNDPRYLDLLKRLGLD